jgi:NADPH:quinone reductase-like Zn-dependent oxidoreductase
MARPLVGQPLGWPTAAGESLVLDGVGGEVARRAFELLERGGRILSFGLASGTCSTSRRTPRARTA